MEANYPGKTGQKLQYYLLWNSFSEKAEDGRKPIRWFLDEAEKFVKKSTRHNCLWYLDNFRSFSSKRKITSYLTSAATMK